jgi:two-component system OmpR family sensor kinase
MEQARALAHERSVTVRGPAGIPSMVVLGDPQRLRQLLLLLLENAVEYSHPSGVVEVSVRLGSEAGEGPATCEVRVADQGIGIAADELPLVFERSFRGAQARKHRANGSGLGLGIARALAAAHGGDIAQDSRPGPGTPVLLRLPLLMERPEELA